MLLVNRLLFGIKEKLQEIIYFIRLEEKDIKIALSRVNLKKRVRINYKSSLYISFIFRSKANRMASLFPNRQMYPI